MELNKVVKALGIIAEAYKDARVVPAENGNPRYLVIERPEQQPMNLPHLEAELESLGFEYSDAHGACWFADLRTR